MNREYQLCLKVTGRKISTYIDGKLINTAEDKLAVIEPLYYTASEELESGDIIIKLVNVQEDVFATELVFDGIEREKLSGTIYEISGYGLEDENNFEFPELIKPEENDFKVEENSFNYEFPGRSITVFRINNIL